MTNFFSKAQTVGKSLMLPIAVLPAAGLLLGIGGALSNPNTVEAYPFLDIGWLQNIFTVMSMAGNIIFANLATLFAIGLAVGLAKSDRGTAGLAAFLAFLVMNVTMSAILDITGNMVEDGLLEAGQGMVLGIQTLETGVLGGIIVGIIVSILHNRYNKKELPQFLGFFSGSRFVPIVASFSAIFLGAAMYIIWPPIQSGIVAFGEVIAGTGPMGTFVYGTVLRLIGPTGLHHLVYMPFWTTALGGTAMVDGELVEGTQRIFFAQLAAQTDEQFYIGTSRYMSGRFAMMMFGLPGAALAMYHTAKPENKKKIGGLLLSGALTSFLTGITEPLEFLFLFVAPFLYLIHAVFDGISFMLAHAFEITIGQTFSGGAIDFFLFGILQGNDRTNWVLVPIIGAGLFVLYYFTFKTLILKFNIMTPGRGAEEVDYSETNVVTDRAEKIIEALGGFDNVTDIDSCATRLRISLKDTSKIDEDALKKTGSRGVVKKGSGVQIIYGPHVTIIKNELEELVS